MDPITTSVGATLTPPDLRNLADVFQRMRNDAFKRGFGQVAVNCGTAAEVMIVCAQRIEAAQTGQQILEITPLMIDEGMRFLSEPSVHGRMTALPSDPMQAVEELTEILSMLYARMELARRGVKGGEKSS